jgi:hypothetical protein
MKRKNTFFPQAGTRPGCSDTRLQEVLRGHEPAGLGETVVGMRMVILFGGIGRSVP